MSDKKQDTPKARYEFEPVRVQKELREFAKSNPLIKSFFEMLSGRTRHRERTDIKAVYYESEQTLKDAMTLADYTKVFEHLEKIGVGAVESIPYRPRFRWSYWISSVGQAALGVGDLRLPPTASPNSVKTIHPKFLHNASILQNSFRHTFLLRPPLGVANVDLPLDVSKEEIERLCLFLRTIPTKD